jgi:hypothetical protein
MIPAEKILWQELRGNKLGVHFTPSALRAPPQIRQCKVCMRIQIAHRWIWGVLTTQVEERT